mmetsp:Transcript_34808/g.69381  ORF Transcript_34808/g.69381 Transcript_34808/m.69381 type:complete len:277 (-) Transcript_34808:211-1041(-)|eukprot:CAMPEP_0174728446 /NCGR_PEP_ID=MMETSP1094-20130205/51748_1 /TAXON_ID=156173 /ORGANISM="Chrysochromulina brevifilum, Strain UTEX LB 985" /LENGTH=276 /DNA_ID=CAMNT_0015930367 /DNA_START=17 /DNA_END=847 /DNA_ORIENTATION=-
MSDIPSSFLESSFCTKVEYEASLKLAPAERGAAERAASAKHNVVQQEKPEDIFRFGGTPARPRKGIAQQLVSGTTFLKPPGSCLSKMPGVHVSLECCEKCNLYVLDPCEQVVCFQLIGCRIVIGPCIGTVTFSNCVDCTIAVVACETRLDNCTNCEVRLFSPARNLVALDSCTGLRFGAWDVAYPGLTKQWAHASSKWIAGDQRNYWDFISESGLAKKAKPCFTLMRGVHPDGRWCQLKISPTGLNGGSVTEVRGSQPSVEGCECPVAAQDGVRFA